MVQRFHIETLGCPKNQVDSDKLAGQLSSQGMVAIDDASMADVVVVNTCAFIESAREESIESVLSAAANRREGARLVVTGCMAERYGAELAAALPEVDAVVGFGVSLLAAAPVSVSVPVAFGRRPSPLDVSSARVSTLAAPIPSFDLLNLPRPAASAPWAYVKIAEGCDRACGFCAIPSFRGPQRSRTLASILEEVDQLGAVEIVLVAQDLASYGRDVTRRGQVDGGPGDTAPGIVDLVNAVSARVARTRLLYLYPSDLTDALIDAVLGTGVAYFDLSLQHVSRPLLRRMRRWGDGDRFMRRIERIRHLQADAAFRSNFIVGYPGETEGDHDQLLAFVREAQLDWCGFFAYSPEAGTYAEALEGVVPAGLVRERLAELTELQDAITAQARDRLIGMTMRVLVDSRGVARSHREAPEIDGIVEVPGELAVGHFHDVEVVSAIGPDLRAVAAVAQ
jgi:ribosomal protein S12 methylthiotransferase